MPLKRMPSQGLFITYLNSCKGVRVVDYGDGLLDTLIGGKRTFIEPMLNGVRFADDRYIKYTAADRLSDALMEVSPAFVKRTYKEFINEDRNIGGGGSRRRS